MHNEPDSNQPSPLQPPSAPFDEPLQPRPPQDLNDLQPKVKNWLRMVLVLIFVGLAGIVGFFIFVFFAAE